MSARLQINSRLIQSIKSYFAGCGFPAEAANSLIEKFERNALELIGKLDTAITAKDTELASQGLHALKGVLANSGLSEEAEQTAELEKLVKASIDWAEINIAYKGIILRLLNLHEDMDGATMEDSTGASKRVLIIDDVEFAREFGKTGLTQLFKSITIDLAENGRIALELMLKNKYDLVLCDWEMPDVKGDQILQAMRNNPNLKSTPFVMVTGREEKEDIMKAIKLGVNDYIIKPLTMDHLNTKIRNLIFGRR